MVRGRLCVAHRTARLRIRLLSTPRAAASAAAAADAGGTRSTRSPPPLPLLPHDPRVPFAAVVVVVAGPGAIHCSLTPAPPPGASRVTLGGGGTGARSLVCSLAAAAAASQARSEAAECAESARFAPVIKVSGPRCSIIPSAPPLHPRTGPRSHPNERSRGVPARAPSAAAGPGRRSAVVQGLGEATFLHRWRWWRRPRRRW